MEIVLNKKRELVIKHKLKSNENYKVSKGSKFKSVHIFKKPQIVKGYSNVCSDGKGILIIDYDNVSFSIVEEDYLFIQKQFNLPPAYLFKTKEDNYHVVCLRKFNQSKIFEILQHTRCDDNFKSMPLRNPYRSYVLRLSDKKGSKKPKFIGIVGKRINLDYEISWGHIILLNTFFPNLHKFTPKYKNLDKSRTIKIHTYETNA